MANIKSQIKRNRQNEQRRLRNKARPLRAEDPREDRPTATIDEGGDQTPPSRVRLAQKRLGKAGAKGVIHKNQAARRTSRLMRRAAKGA